MTTAVSSGTTVATNKQQTFDDVVVWAGKEKKVSLYTTSFIITIIVMIILILLVLFVVFSPLFSKKKASLPIDVVNDPSNSIKASNGTPIVPGSGNKTNKSNVASPPSNNPASKAPKAQPAPTGNGNTGNGSKVPPQTPSIRAAAVSSPSS